MPSVYVFLANDFEEMEALIPVDFLRRADITVHTVGVGAKAIEGAHGIIVQADMDGAEFTLPQDADMVMLPGGGRGVENLRKSDMVSCALQEAQQRGIYIAAICAAPAALCDKGFLQGKRVTAFPSVQAQLTGCEVTGGAVELDGNIITARSAGVALEFAYELAVLLAGEKIAGDVLHNLYPNE